MAQQELLCLKSVSLKYRDTLAVKNLELAVYPGEILGLLGPNGCGKSTNAIAGNHELDSGCILLDGQSHTQHPLSYRAQIGFVPQELAFYEELSPYANLRFFGNIYGIHGNDLSQRIAEILNLVRLEDRAYIPAFGFSGGMKRRLIHHLGKLFFPAFINFGMKGAPSFTPHITSKKLYDFATK